MASPCVAARHLAGFRDAYPSIGVELVVANATFNLSRREADIALRVGDGRQRRWSGAS